jgi:hypothetical protein
MTSMTVAAICILVVAVPLLVYAWQGWRNFRRPAGWTKLPARVVKSWLAEIEIDIGEGSIKGWEPRIMFSYVGRGGPRTGTQLSLDEKGFQYSNHSAALRFLGRFPPGTEVVAHVPPSGGAVMLVDISWARKSHYLACAVSGFLLAILAAFFIVLA